MSILKKSGISAFSLVICLLLAVVIGCSSPAGSARYADNPVAERETLTQVSTIDALMAGLYDGLMSCGQLKGYGDFGIGTFHALDGEMVMLDGRIYQVKADGVAYPVPDSLEVPFAAVTFFDSDYESVLMPGATFAEVQAFVDLVLPTENIFFAIRIEGTFGYMKTRSVPAQEKPYPPLVEVTANQVVFEFEDVTGTMVGFRCPAYVSSLNVPGYHLHFLTADCKAGGHVLEFTVNDAVVSIDETSNFLMFLPGEGSGFYEMDLTADNVEELENAER